MLQQTLAKVTFEQYRKPTRRERFLDEMSRVVPWAELVAVIEPVYPKADGPGRPPVGIERMLRDFVRQAGSAIGRRQVACARATEHRGSFSMLPIS